MKPIRVIFINTADRRIMDTTVSCLKDMQQLVGGKIERAGILLNNDELYVNEEGFFERPNVVFEFIRIGQLVGNAYIIGPVDEDGNNGDALSSVEDVKNQILWKGILT